MENMITKINNCIIKYYRTIFKLYMDTEEPYSKEFFLWCGFLMLSIILPFITFLLLVCEYPLTMLIITLLLGTTSGLFKYIYTQIKEKWNESE